MNRKMVSTEASTQWLNETNSTDNQQDLPTREWEQTLLYALRIERWVLLPCGLLSNLVFFIMMARVPNLRTTTNLYLLNLSIANFLYISIFCVFVLFAEFSDQLGFDYNSYMVCIPSVLFQYTFSNTSLLTITLISIERYVSVCHPIKAKELKNKTCKCSSLILLWIVAIILAIPFPIGHCQYTEGLNWISRTKLATSLVDIVTVLIPLCIVVILYSLIMHQIYVRRLKQIAEKKKQQIIHMLILTSVVFFACVCPYVLYVIIFDLGGANTTEKNQVIAYAIVSELLIFNAVVDPMIYISASPQHRKGFVQALVFTKQKTSNVVMSPWKSYQNSFNLTTGAAASANSMATTATPSSARKSAVSLNDDKKPGPNNHLFSNKIVSMETNFDNLRETAI